MTMPAGIQKKTKDNSGKKYREHEEWQVGKKLGRPKQRWVLVFDEPLTADAGEQPSGHWEKVTR